MPVLLRICHTFQPSFVGAASAAEPATSTSDFGAIILFTSHWRAASFPTAARPPQQSTILNYS
ncbi:MAG TPA: hypothetical protein VGQ99_06870 [Tepidisphaeraceae bacterium]|nr:hypothetical protein [Tepidisphaeraceae bacterium]